MNVQVKLEIHAFVEERLCDECFDAAPHYGINGPEIMYPLSIKRNHIMTFQYDAQTSLRDIINAVKREIWGDSEAGEYAPVIYGFLVHNERYYIVDDSQSLMKLLPAYLDPDDTGTITFCILVSCNAGDVARGGPLRYYVHSREAGRHNEPHIHVRDTSHRYEASVRISDGKVIAGELPRKYEKMAKEKILSDQNYFYECWNTRTDGLQADINHHYGYIEY